MNSFLKYIDVLVDGPFILSQKSFDVKFRGSKNQRIIDVVKSLKENKIIEMVKDPSGNYGFKVKYQEDAPDFLKKALPEYF